MKAVFVTFALFAAAFVAVRAEEESEKEDIGTVIGIDLGTTYSWCVPRPPAVCFVCDFHARDP